MPDINGLEVIAQIALGLAGFSGVMIALARSSGEFSPPARLRLRALIYASFGAMFLAIIPFAVFGDAWSESTSWQVVGFVMTLYTAAGFFLLPPAAYRLFRDHRESFPLPLVVILFSNHMSTFLLALVVLFGSSEYRASAYIMVLILLLMHGAIAFVRVLFYRN